MRIARHCVGLALFGATFGCARNFYRSAAEWKHTDTARATAQDVDRVRLDSRQGPIRFEGTSAVDVAVRLRVGPARGKMGVARKCDVVAAPMLRRDGRTLRVAADRTLPEDCVAEWTVTLPRGLAVEARVGSGDITVEGVAGGVIARADAGDLRVRASDGEVHANTGVGDVELDYIGNEHGGLSAETNVGSIELTVNGRKLSHRGAPGSGDELRLDGSAANVIRVTVNVGDIAIRVGTAPSTAPPSD